MFKILVVEDDSIKLRYLLKALEGIDGLNSEMVDHELDSTSAKKKLKENFYDLLIVDIAIPIRKSDAPSLDEGINLVKEILERDIYHKPSHIIGLTALEEVFETAFKEFNNNVLSVIRYSDSDSEWETKITAAITQWINSKSSLLNSGTSYDYDVAIITAVDVEAEAVKNLSEEWKRVTFPNDSTLYWETTFRSENKSFRVIASTLTQMGMNASSVLTMKLIYNFRPRYIFMPGIAASIKDSAAHGFGDVFVIDESWDGGAGKIVQDKDGKYEFEPVALHLRLDRDLSEKMRAIKDNTSLLRDIKDKFRYGIVPNTELKVHLGSVVSVAGVVANAEVSKELAGKDRKLLGLEMEAYGMYYSSSHCSAPKPLAMALKSVCDYANHNKSDNYQAYAAYTSAQVMLSFILDEV